MVTEIPNRPMLVFDILLTKPSKNSYPKNKNGNDKKKSFGNKNENNFAALRMFLIYLAIYCDLCFYLAHSLVAH